MRGGRVETLSKYWCKILEIINKLMNFFMNHGLISLNTASTPQNIFRMIIENHILMIWNVSEKSSNNSPSAQVLHHQFKGRGQDLWWSWWFRGGGPKFVKTWWCDTWTLPKVRYPSCNPTKHQIWLCGIFVSMSEHFCASMIPGFCILGKFLIVTLGH